MANETVGFEVDVDLGSFRQQLRTAQQEAFALVDKFGQFSPEAANAAKRVAELRDKIGDTNSLIKAFNPDQKFAAFGQAIRTVAGGFTAVQGAMALFGKQSEEVQQQLLKVQAALALTEGINTFLDDGIQGFKNLATVIKGSVVTAFTTLRGALIATGIGAAAVAVAALVANWDKLVKVFKDTFPVVEGLGEKFNDLKAGLAGVGNAIFQFLITPVKVWADLINGEFKTALEDFKKGIDFANNFQDGQREQRASQANDARKAELEAIIKAEEDKLDILKASGAETYELERANLDRKLELYDQDTKEYAEAWKDRQLLDASEGKKQADAQKALNEKSKQEQERLAKEAEAERVASAKAAADAILKIQQELALAGKTERDKELEALRQWYDEQKKIIQKGGGDLAALEDLNQKRRGAITLKYIEQERDKQLEDLQKREAATQAAGEVELARVQSQAQVIAEAVRGYGENERISVRERLATLDALEKTIVANTELNEAQKTGILAEASAARVTIAQQEAAAKEFLISNEIAILESAAAIAGQQTALGKSLAVAATVISTWSAGQRAFESQFIPGDPSSVFRATIAAAAAVAAGLARVKAILAVKIPGQGSQGSAPTLSQPIGLGGLGRGVSNPTQDLLAQQINEKGQPVRVFVVERDITNTQDRVKRLNRTAVLGG